MDRFQNTCIHCFKNYAFKAFVSSHANQVTSTTCDGTFYMFSDDEHVYYSPEPNVGDGSVYSSVKVTVDRNTLEIVG